MSKTIYTERDIQDLARRGVKEIAVTEEVYVTDVARERAEKLGIALRTAVSPTAPFASAPVKPARENIEPLVQQVKADVIAKLGPGVDAALIERIVRRVVSQIS